MLNALRLWPGFLGKDGWLHVVAATTKYSAGFRDLYAKCTQIKQSPRSDNDNAAAFVFYPPFYPFPLPQSASSPTPSSILMTVATGHC